MFDFQQKRKIRAMAESRAVWVVLLILATFVLVSTYERYTIARDMSHYRAEAERELESLKMRHSELEAEVKYLSNERGIEAEMRRQFDVARDGEKVVVIVEADETKATETATTTPDKRPWYRFW
jgi:cell division protein FtsB